MKTLDDTYDLIQSMNERAHSESWDSWIKADEYEESEEDDPDVSVESLREEASLEQAEYFRDFYDELSPEEQDAIKYWIKNDQSFRSDFRGWYGPGEFEEDFDFEQ